MGGAATKNAKGANEFNISPNTKRKLERAGKDALEAGVVLGIGAGTVLAPEVAIPAEVAAAEAAGAAGAVGAVGAVGTVGAVEVGEAAAGATALETTAKLAKMPTDTEVEMARLNTINNGIGLAASVIPLAAGAVGVSGPAAASTGGGEWSGWSECVITCMLLIAVIIAAVIVIMIYTSRPSTDQFSSKNRRPRNLIRV